MALRHSPPVLPMALITIGLLCGFVGSVIDASKTVPGSGRAMTEYGIAVFAMGSLMQIFLWCVDLGTSRRPDSRPD